MKLVNTQYKITTFYCTRKMELNVRYCYEGIYFGKKKQIKLGPLKQFFFST